MGGGSKTGEFVRLALCEAWEFGAKFTAMSNQPHTFTVVLEPAEEGGFVVTVPALPELGTQGDTHDEAMANAREAIELVLEDHRARGLHELPPSEG